MQFVATCPRYLEEPLQVELLALGITQPRQTVGAVTFDASLQQGYRVCLWSRLSSRVLLELHRAKADDRDSIYAAVAAVDWMQHLTVKTSFAIDFTGKSEEIRNSQFGAQLVKDAIVDSFQRFGERPSVNLKSPDIRLNVRLHKGELTIAIDLSGRSLHQRGYRDSGGSAPLKENLAAAILQRAGWGQQMSQGDILLDPMCGSATILIEAALMASDTAPGLNRSDWGFRHWPGHDAAIWAELVNEARARRKTALLGALPEIRGFDANPAIIKPARINIANAGVEDLVDVQCRDLSGLTPPTHRQFNNALIVTNPPYGERLGEVEELTQLYHHFGMRLKERFSGWRLAMITSNPKLAGNMRLRADKKYRLRNGALEAELLLYRLTEEGSTQRGSDSGTELKKVQSNIAPIRVQWDTDEGLANRLRKNRQRLKKMVKQRDTDCYRLYDADLPEFASAIDVYADHVVVAEYVAPKTIDEKVAKERFQLTLTTVADVLDLPASRVHAKRRERQSGKRQYQRVAEENNFLTVREGPARFRVNPADYLDTGLFLDHRALRYLLHKECKGKTVLNLFCYTAAITVQAALGGAKRTVSVDMSKTYLDWAGKNLALNGLSQASHQLVQADCLQWLQGLQQKYDIIVLDPPSFSNSKRMESVLDVQRDHAHLIELCMPHLNDGGSLYFSTNKRRLKLDAILSERYQISDITPATLDLDFARGTPIHQCWVIQHA